MAGTVACQCERAPAPCQRTVGKGPSQARQRLLHHPHHDHNERQLAQPAQQHAAAAAGILAQPPLAAHARHALRTVCLCHPPALGRLVCLLRCCAAAAGALDAGSARLASVGLLRGWAPSGSNRRDGCGIHSKKLYGSESRHAQRAAVQGPRDGLQHKGWVSGRGQLAGGTWHLQGFFALACLCLRPCSPCGLTLKDESHVRLKLQAGGAQGTLMTGQGAGDSSRGALAGHGRCPQMSWTRPRHSHSDQHRDGILAAAEQQRQDQVHSDQRRSRG